MHDAIPGTDHGLTRGGKPLPTASVQGIRAIGRSVREARYRLGLTQIALENLTGIDQTVISRLENGRLSSLIWWRFALLIGVLGPAWMPDPSNRSSLGRPFLGRTDESPRASPVPSGPVPGPIAASAAGERWTGDGSPSVDDVPFAD